MIIKGLTVRLSKYRDIDFLKTKKVLDYIGGVFLELKKEFHKEMISIYRNAKKECGYNATRFLQMLAAQEGLSVAKSLIHINQPTDGFSTLWELGRLDLTVEALILQPKYQELFSEEERRIGADRLKEYGYEIE